MTDEQFLNPPSVGMWLVLAICGSVLANAILGPGFETVSAWVVVIAGLIAGYVFFRWLGRVAGYLVGQFIEGYKETRVVNLPSDESAP